MYSEKMNSLISLISKLNPDLDTKEVYEWAFTFNNTLKMNAIDSEQFAIQRIIKGYAQEMFDSGTQANTLILGYYEAKVLELFDQSNLIVEIKQNDRAFWIGLNTMVIDSLHAIIVK